MTTTILFLAAQAAVAFFWAFKTGSGGYAALAVTSLLYAAYLRFS